MLLLIIENSKTFKAYHFFKAALNEFVKLIDCEQMHNKWKAKEKKNEKYNYS